MENSTKTDYNFVNVSSIRCSWFLVGGCTLYVRKWGIVLMAPEDVVGDHGTEKKAVRTSVSACHVLTRITWVLRIEHLVAWLCSRYTHCGVNTHVTA
eukprot:6131715-Amphidinium_carterae.1